MCVYWCFSFFSINNYGCLKCFYAGKVHVRESFKTIEDVNAVFYNSDGEENDLAMSRYDGVVVDGSTAGQEAPNPFGYGHLINHPPPGIHRCADLQYTS